MTLAVFAVAPLAAGFVLDWLCGTRARWWRWWFLPLVAGLPGIRFVIAAAVQGQPYQPGVEYLYPLWFVVVLFFLLCVLLPVVTCSIGVFLRRWAASTY